MTDDGTATYYLLDGTEYTEGPNGNYFTYYHSINGDTVAFTRSDVTTWMGSDIVNSTAVTADENGTISTQRYTPFGETRNNGNLDTDHLYTGQFLDETSGLAFYNARYYDPPPADSSHQTASCPTLKMDRTTTDTPTCGTIQSDGAIQAATYHVSSATIANKSNTTRSGTVTVTALSSRLTL